MQGRLPHAAVHAATYSFKRDRQHVLADFLREGSRYSELAAFPKPQPRAQRIVPGAEHLRATGCERAQLPVRAHALHQEGGFGLVELSGDLPHVGVGKSVCALDDRERVAAQGHIRKDIDQTRDQLDHISPRLSKVICTHHCALPGSIFPCETAGKIELLSLTMSTTQDRK